MTVDARPDWAAGLINLLDQQRGIYQQLHDLGREQSRLVAEGEAEPLLELLARRQRLIDELTHINGHIEPYKTNWTVLWGRLDENRRLQVQQRIDEVQRLIEAIFERDERDREALNAQRQRVGSGIRHVRAGSAVNRAYTQAPAAAAPRYTDQRG